VATLSLGTRGSQLALFQAHTVAALLQNRSGITCDVVVIKTSGDTLAEAPLAHIGGKRLFVKEIEEALLNGEIDLAVHSSKDMPAVLPEGLAVGAVLPREDARDALVLPAGRQGPPYDLTSVGRGLTPRQNETLRIGTSSVRRTAQLIQLFRGARFEPVRGNLDTRLRKLDAGEYDALVLAAAGLKRLGHGGRISMALSPRECVPAPGQGIIAVEIRSSDTVTREAVEPINDPTAAAALSAERAVVVQLGGGCQMPIGAYADASSGRLVLTAIVISVDGERSARADTEGPFTDAERIGSQAAAQLLVGGAGDILAEVEHARASVEGLQP
jgi:hydroxymethylbilane synthase